MICGAYISLNGWSWTRSGRREIERFNTERRLHMGLEMEGGEDATEIVAIDEGTKGESDVFGVSAKREKE